MLHDEVYDIAAFSAGEALAQSFGRRYVERRCFVVMERAQTYIVHPAFSQGDEVRYHINDLCGIKYAVYGGLVYHNSNTKLPIKNEDTKKK